MAYIISRPWGGHCGVGHQFQNWLTGYLLSSRYKLQFVHSPFCGDIIESQIDVPVRMWEKFLGFGKGFIRENQLPQDIKRIALPKIDWNESSWDKVTCDHPVWSDIIRNTIDDNVLFECAKDQFVGLGWEYFDSERLRANYDYARKESPMTTYFDYGKLNVAIHIRRGDVTENGEYKVRWVGNNVYKNVMNQIRSQFENVAFHIYSDGTRENLSDLDHEDTVLHLKTNIFETFHQMVSSDMLMPGQSAFSVLAAHLFRGTILARGWSPIWSNFPNDKRFVIIDQEGSMVNELA